MNPLRLQYARLFELLAQLAERQLSDADAVELRELLLADPVARDIYRQYQVLVAGLSWECTDPAAHAGPHLAEVGSTHTGATERTDAASRAASFGGIARPLVQPILGLYRGTAATLSRPVFWSILVAGAAFCTYATVLLWNLRSGELPGDNDREAAVVATMRDSEDVEWSSKKSEIANLKTQIVAGQPLSIEAGLIELQLKQGTTLLIEGPAEWEIDGENSATLKLGKLVAKVPKRAVGFTLETPNAKIVDLGTEFEVIVRATGEEFVQVRRGEVELTSGREARSPAAPLRLKQSQAASLRTIDGQLQAVPIAFQQSIAPPRPSPVRVSKRSAQTGELPFSGFDLIEAGSASLKGQSATPEESRDESNPLGLALNNGTLYNGAESSIGFDRCAYCPLDGASVTFDLNLDESPHGYDLLWIMSIAGGGQGRANQYWKLEFARVGSDDFELLVGEKEVRLIDEELHRETQVKLTREDNQLLAENVARIRITYFDTPDTQFQYSMYRELDVFGRKSRQAAGKGSQ